MATLNEDDWEAICTKSKLILSTELMELLVEENLSAEEWATFGEELHEYSSDKQMHFDIKQSMTPKNLTPKVDPKRLLVKPGPLSLLCHCYVNKDEAAETLSIQFEPLKIMNLPLGGINYTIKIKLYGNKSTKIAQKKTKTRHSQKDTNVFTDKYIFEVPQDIVQNQSARLEVTVVKSQNFMDKVLAHTILRINDIAHERTDDGITLTFGAEDSISAGQSACNTPKQTNEKKLNNDNDNNDNTNEEDYFDTPGEYNNFVLISLKDSSNTDNKTLSLKKDEFIKLVPMNDNKLKGYILHRYGSNPETGYINEEDVMFPLIDENISFRHFLGLETTRNGFSKFLEKEHSSENIQFWNDVELYTGEFRNHSDEEAIQDYISWTSEMKAISNRIYDTYLSPSAPLLVNISSSTAKHIRKIFNDRSQVPVDSSLFCKSQEEIFKMMEKDSFQRFKQSPMFPLLIHTASKEIQSIDKHNPVVTTYIKSDSVLWAVPSEISLSKSGGRDMRAKRRMSMARKISKA